MRVLDYFCSGAHLQTIFFLGRPLLPDPKDDLVLELAFAAGCRTVVTYHDSLHRQLRELAEREGVSMNQLISSAVGEKLASLLTVDYLRERGVQGKRSAYDRVLRRVRSVPPQEGDALPNKELKLTKRG